MNSIISNDADIAICDIFIKYENSDTLDIRQYACLDEDDKLSYIDNGLAASPCNKIFKKELLIQYPFAEGIMNEDVPTIVPIMIKANKIVYCRDTFYNYIQRDKSVQNSGVNEKRLEIFKALDILETRVPRNKANKKYWDALIFNQIMLFVIYVIPKEKRLFKRCRFLRKFFNLSKKYDMNNNVLWQEFLEKQGKKYKIFYKMYLKLCYYRLFFLASISVSLVNFYSDKLKRPVINNKASLKDLIKVAKKQHRLKNNDYNLSVVVPNYNYADFLYQRIYSILNQDIKIHELIILDDCSKDNSREVIDKIVESLQDYINISKVYNTNNSGSAFKQWQKGFELATGDYVWIAEADDYCHKHFLKNVTKPLIDKDVVISYTDTAFIDKKGYMFMRTIRPEIDLMKTGHWNHDYVNDGLKEIEDYEFLNCTISNVSSVIFKKGNYKKFFAQSGEYRQVGDYLFYFNVMTTGKVAYCAKAYNYYRVHGNNVTSTTKKQAHFDELVRVHEYIDSKIHFTEKQKAELRKRYKFLKKVWGIKIK